MLLRFDPFAFFLTAVRHHQSANNASDIVGVDRFTRFRIHDRQSSVQFIFMKTFQKTKIFLIFLFFAKDIIVQCGLDVQTGASADDRHFASMMNVSDQLSASLLKFPDIIFFLIIMHINQMMNDSLLLFLFDLGTADVQFSYT